jgi:hypothetical protein
MPFIVTTKRPTIAAKHFGADEMRAVSRRAVATLVGAQAACEEIVMDTVNVARDGKGNLFPALSYSPHVFDAQEMTGLGGSVGPLPDGTVIEVEPIGPIALFHAAGLTRGQRPHLSVAGVIAAYNARHGGAS